MEVLKLNGLSKANLQDYCTLPLEYSQDYCTTVRNNPDCAPEGLVEVQGNFMVMVLDNALSFNTSISL